MREGKIPPNWTYLAQRISQSVATDNIDLKDTFLTPNHEEDTSKTPRHKPSLATENNNQPIILLQSKPHVK